MNIIFFTQTHINIGVSCFWSDANVKSWMVFCSATTSLYAQCIYSKSSYAVQRSFTLFLFICHIRFLSVFLLKIIRAIFISIMHIFFTVKLTKNSLIEKRRLSHAHHLPSLYWSEILTHSITSKWTSEYQDGQLPIQMCQWVFLLWFFINFNNWISIH